MHYILLFEIVWVSDFSIAFYLLQTPGPGLRVRARQAPHHSKMMIMFIIIIIQNRVPFWFCDGDRPIYVPI